MNILFLTTHFNEGGISRYCLSLAKQFKKRGHGVFIASSGGNLADGLSAGSIEHIILNIRTKSELSPKIWLSLRQISGVLREKNIQIIHAQTRVTQVLAFWIEKFYKVPYVSTCHGFFKPRLSRRIFPAWGKAVIAISRPVEKHLIDDLKVPAEKVKYIRHGVDLSDFLAVDKDIRWQAREKLNITKGPIIGIIARLSDVKGHEFLIKALPEVLKEFPQVNLLIVGDGPLKERLIAVCEEIKVSENVKFISSAADNLSILAALDVFVMPSLQEGLGLSIMEAMAAAVPVIATNVGGIPELIKDNQTGILVPPADSVALSRALIRILKDNELKRNLADRAKRFIQEEFPLDKMVSETDALYQSVLG